MNPSDRTEVREMLEGVLKGWHSETVLREITANKSLDSIEKHLGDLNGNIKDHSLALEALRLADAKHIIDCPVGPKVEALSEDLIEYRVLKKYPKLGLITLAVAVILVAINVFGIFETTKERPESAKIEQVLQDRYDVIIARIDSLHNE